MSVKSEVGILEEIEAKQALHDLNTTYCRAIDRMDRELLISLWHDNAVVEYGSFKGSGKEFTSHAARPDDGKERTFTSISNEYFEVNGEEARGEIYVITVSTLLDGNEKTDQLIGGRYLDSYKRIGDIWKIARRTFVFDWNMNHPTTAVWDEGLFGMIKLRGCRSKQDPVYQLLGGAS